MIKSRDVREQFIKFFTEKHGHHFIPSSPVVPLTDPTLLFTNAGMNQFKPYFLGEQVPEITRAVNTQKCIRVSGKHNDLEEVGRDTYHHTFFEMLGNWSFGDYYKAEAIEWAWELFTKVWGLDRGRLYATVYRDDDEAFDLWKKISGLPQDRILRFGEKDNFWEMGDTGPCGPCSEIHYYRGDSKIQDPGRINADDPEYIELWNLVFIQYNRDEHGILTPLPKKHVDTGAGFERLVATLNGANSNYDTDVFFPLLGEISRISGHEYDKGTAGMPHRVIADHIRMLSFAIADGAIPGNDGRSYVLRRILRRAVRYGRQLNLHDPFLYRLVDVLASQMSDVFPELSAQKDHISNIIKGEEESFSVTLDRGLEIFEQISSDCNRDKRTLLSGSEVFKLYDTFGFPMDLTRLLAEEKSLAIDEKGFDALMTEQKERARAAGKFKTSVKDSLEWVEVGAPAPTKFLGYEDLEADATCLKYAVSSEDCFIVCDVTPCYAESGGQVGDHGRVIFENGTKADILDTLIFGEDRVMKLQRRDDLPELLKTPFRLVVDRDRRRNTARNHSATHLLHQALKDVLGGHVRQSGSWVGPEYLRFDFNHHTRISDEELAAVQQRVNEKILAAETVTIKSMGYHDAVDQGAMALFGEKYSEEVRTVRMGDYSFELCGGTHVENTSDIGLFVIVSESSVASGVRRIEALTGRMASEKALESIGIADGLAHRFQCTVDELPSQVDALQRKKSELEKQLSQMEKNLLLSDLDSFLAAGQTLGDIRVISRFVDAGSMDLLKELGDKLRERCEQTIIILGMNVDGQPQVLAAVTDDLQKKGYHAGKIVGRIGKALGGGGGGRPHMATAGGKDPDLLEKVLENFEPFVEG